MRYFLFLLGIFIFFNSCSVFSKENEIEAKFKKIKKGMSRIEVINILGTPSNIQIDSNDVSHIEYMYYHPNSTFELNSDVPTVMLDSNKKVIFAAYGNGD